MTYYTEEGYHPEVYASIYLDWGLAITKDGETLFNLPSCLSNENYGWKPHPRFDGEWAAAEEWSLRATPRQQSRTPAFVPWTDADWRECLKAESDTFIEAYIGDGGEA